LQPDVVVIANDLGGAAMVRETVPMTKIISWLHNECPFSPSCEESLSQTDAFLCCSEYIREWFLAKFRIEPSRVKTALAGVDQDQFFPSTAEPSPVLRLLFVGRLDPNKGVDTAVEVASQLRRKGAPVKLTVAGHLWFYRGDAVIENPFLRQLTIDMRDGGVDWVGHVPRRWLPGLMREHDVVLVLSRSQEPFGLVVLEAMASGLAVVASPHGGLREACGEAGVFVDPNDETAIQNLLEDFCTDRSLLHSWRRRSLERASSASWRETANVLLHSVAACAQRF
jgi:glycosyltransferase involved in cell wall biosynthesis